jgi:hypothetical protein
MYVTQHNLIMRCQVIFPLKLTFILLSQRITKAQILFNMKELEFIATFEYYSFIRGLIFELIVRTDMKGLM